MPQVEFGVRLPVAGPLASPEAIGRIACQAEQLGFDAVWVHDFVVWNAELDAAHISCGSAEAVEAAQRSPEYAPLFYESLMSLAYVAGLTRRIRVGVAVLCVPFRNPIVTAKQVATLDALSGGRLILGIGVGAAKTTGNQDFEVLGISRADKYRLTRDYVAAMKAIWSEPHPSYEGPFVRFSATEIDPKPVQKPHPPLWLGGAGPKAVELTAELGTGWLPGRVSATHYPERIAELRDAACSKGRGDVDFTIGSEIYACVGRTGEEARRTSGRTLGVHAEAGGFTESKGQEPAAQHALVGSTEEVAEKVAGYVSAGVRHFEMKFIYPDVDHLSDQLELFARGVMREFR